MLKKKAAIRCGLMAAFKGVTRRNWICGKLNNDAILKCNSDSNPSRGKCPPLHALTDDGKQEVKIIAVVALSRRAGSGYIQFAVIGRK